MNELEPGNKRSVSEEIEEKSQRIECLTNVLFEKKKVRVFEYDPARLEWQSFMPSLKAWIGENFQDRLKNEFISSKTGSLRLRRYNDITFIWLSTNAFALHINNSSDNWKILFMNKGDKVSDNDHSEEGELKRRKIVAEALNMGLAETRFRAVIAGLHNPF